MDSEFPLLNSLGFGWGRGPEIRFAKKSYSNFQKCPFCFPGHQNDPWILFKKWALLFLMDFVCSLPFLETLIYIYIYTSIGPHLPIQAISWTSSHQYTPRHRHRRPNQGQDPRNLSSNTLSWQDAFCGESHRIFFCGCALVVEDGMVGFAQNCVSFHAFFGGGVFFSGWALFVKDWKLTFDPKNTCKSWCLSSICAVFSVAVEMPLNLKRSCNSSSCFTAITFSDSEPLGSMGEFHLWTLLRFEPFRDPKSNVRPKTPSRQTIQTKWKRQPNRKKMKKENGTEY